MDHSKQLATEKVSKLLIKFSIPAIVGMLVNALYNIVDRIFIGNGVGALAISGLSITFPIVIIIMAFGMLVGIGSAASISIKLGENKKDEAEKILGNAFILSIVVSIIVTILGFIFMDDVLKSFGASDKTIYYVKEYLSIILIGAVLQNIGFGLNNIIRAEGNPKVAMKTMLIGAITNTILDPIFIFIFKLGIKGAALATIISQGINAIWVLNYFVKGNSTLKLKTENFKLNKKIIITIFSIGMSPFAMQIAASFVNVILNKNLVRYGGDFAIGAMGIINSISMLILMPIFGINQGSQPIIGYNYGAKQNERVKKTLKAAIFAATTIATFGFILVETIPDVLIKIFSSDSEQLIDIGTKGIRVFLFMLPIIGFQIVCSNYFQAIGKAKISILLSLSRQVIVLIPLLLILPKYLGLKGVWLSAPISDITASLLTAVFIFKEMKDLK
ncbi:multidrug export protein MepA [Clostridium acetireducens DSM 10703]|uniref:Multidrug export protein MepA n=1 Tax=Clostridium acetireducens DSM 10703 TaxID=1121290 RepID=A0A1E8F017_9CLOT|nr:MATE family efflux transporter [Clostridium acetireducens]OFI06778.1 multidrug export protein MepA [Clostridium acetireducens DSM 10703]